MIWTSGCWNKPRTLVWPCPPQPTIARLIFSLGATNFVPPSTCRGTRVIPATAVVVPARNLRRVRGCLLVFDFIDEYLIARPLEVSRNHPDGRPRLPAWLLRQSGGRCCQPAPQSPPRFSPQRESGRPARRRRLRHWFRNLPR